MSDFLAGGRAGRGRGSPGDEPRNRRALDRGTTGADLAPPLALDKEGRVTIALDPRGALGITPQGQIYLRLGEGLELVPGSPHTLRVKRSQTITSDVQGRLRARSSTTEIRNTSTLFGKTLKQALNALKTLTDEFVRGPASATDSAVPLWDGNDGRLLKDSGLFLSDTPGVPSTTVIPLTIGPNGVLRIGFLATGVPTGKKFVRDDSTLAVPAFGGFDGTITPPALVASVNNYNPAGLAGAAVLRLSAA